MSSFDYFFPDVAMDQRLGLISALADLANGMIDPPVGMGGDEPAQNNDIAPLYSYIGQLLSHDLVAPRTDGDPLGDGQPALCLNASDLIPLERDTVTAVIKNGRSGGLHLESVYGDALGSEGARALRDPTDPALMCLTPLPDSASPLGDARNASSLLLRNLVSVLLAFHNAVATALPDCYADPDERHAEARRRVCWTWQWLIVNDYLPAICDPITLSWVHSSRAPLYRAFYTRNSMLSDGFPVPIEFAFAVTGLPHTMLRAAYDLNTQFGRPGAEDARQGARLEDLLGLSDLSPTDAIAVDWDRLIAPPAAYPDRAARRFDTGLAHTLGWLPAADGNLPPNLAARMLNAGYRLSMPTAQGVLAALTQHDSLHETHPPLRPLSVKEIGSGETGHIMRRHGFVDRTPLWFYLLKEAEIRHGGEHLGTLGTRLLAETVIGLLISDPDSFWHAPSDQAGVWTPERMPVGQQAVISFAGLFQVAGVIGNDLPPGGSISNGVFTGV
ncbi:peroxidase family protein [Actibacterium sp. 188UL27-1]|uniref:peroxidase family protein n=1 Tax=Actibacterium sp. 188UL27-1 TaxID=2786961 RepID=UPI00195756A1|nr:peroxidase family protein [Actibacterium sp. 188UL27-1]MBM7068423.1 hypothetical protein [Actibacterium sp. 188UL27-1]